MCRGPEAELARFIKESTRGSESWKAVSDRQVRGDSWGQILGKETLESESSLFSGKIYFNTLHLVRSQCRKKRGIVFALYLLHHLHVPVT